MKSIVRHKSSKGLPRLIDATTFKDLSEIILIRSNRYPTNYLDLLLLKNKNKQLSEILSLYKRYKAKNRDFKTIARIKYHITYRVKNDGWIFNITGDIDNPIVRLTGLKNKT
jgi:hypothetical protein